MASPAPAKAFLTSRFLPLTAVVRDDLRQLLKHWAIFAWVILASMFFVLSFATIDRQGAAALSSGELPAAAVDHVMSASEFVARLLRMHLIWWSTFVIALGATAIAAESEVASSAVLCRGISRVEYYLGKCIARVLGVVIVFILLTLPGIGLAAARLSNDLTLAGILAACGAVSLLTASLVLVAIAGGVWFKNPLLAAVIVWMTLYGVGILLCVTQPAELSPLGLVSSLPAMLRGSANPPTHELPTFAGSVALFSTFIALVWYSRTDL